MDQFMVGADVLLVEDNPADVRLTKEALKNSRVINRLNVVNDGAEAIDYLHKMGKYNGTSTPDLILLDLNLPKKTGKEVLTDIKRDKTLKSIPVVILTTSQSEEDIQFAYQEHANCYLTKPVDFDQYLRVVSSIEDFWLTLVKLPSRM